MTENSGESNGDTEGNSEEHMPVSSPKGAAGSRFDAFLERFDDPGSEKERSLDNKTDVEKKGVHETENDTGEADTDTDTDSRIGETPEDTLDRTTALDEWIWTGPRQPQDDEQTPDSSGTKADLQTERQPPQSDGSGDRIWHRSPQEGFDMASPKTSESTQGEGSDSISGHSDSKEDDGSDKIAGRGDRPEDEQKPDGIQQDRWSKLGSGLRTDEDTTSEPADHQTESAGPVGSSGGEKRTSDRETDPPSWNPTDETASSGGNNAGETPSLDAGRSQDIDRVTDDASVLVLGPRNHPVSDAICSRFLVGPSGPRDVLFVTFEESPGERIDVCNHADGWEGGKIGVVRIGRESRNAAATSETTTAQGGGSITVRHVAKPGDLSKLGIVISQLLTAFEGTSRETVVCFHTLSALHTQTGTKTLFRFLNTLQGRLRSAGAIGHYHMDPDLHDEIVIETLRPLFDSAVRYSADGELEIE